MTIRVAICEDSASYAHGLRRLLEVGGELEVVTVAATAEALLRELSGLAPDLVTMDLELPGIDGAEAVRRIMRDRPTPIVVLSAHAGRSGWHVADALAAGALEAISKGDVNLADEDGATATALRRRLVRLAGHRREATASPVDRRSATVSIDRVAAPLPTAPTLRADTIGIVSSTGGPGALRTILKVLPAAFPLPVLVVQHIGEGFTEGLVHWLQQVLDVPVRLARDGERVGRGVVVAPSGQHLLLGPDRRLHLDGIGHPGPYRPSGDVLLSSIASAVGPRGLGVVLTGMGRDGAEGVADLVRLGGSAWAEPPGDAAVWGMPAAAVHAGATPRALAAIGAGLVALAARRAP